MSKLLLNAKKRDEIGTGSSKKIRREGMVPGILYGSHRESTEITLEKGEVDRLLHHNAVGAKVYIKLDGKEIMTILKDVQRQVLLTNVLHVDFQELTAGEKVKLSIPVNIVGKENLPSDVIVQELLHEIEIKALPQDLIDSITVDISNMEFGVPIKVEDLEVSKDNKFEVLSDLSLNVVTLVAQAKTEVVSGEEASEPELIGEKKE